MDQALSAVGQYRHARSVFLFRDAAGLLCSLEHSPDYVRLIRRIKDLDESLNADGNAIVLLASWSTVPPELADCVTLIEATLPNHSERLAIVRFWTDKHADDFMEDGREIARLPHGQAIACNPEWGSVKIAVRPPLSKVWEPPDPESRRSRRTFRRSN